MINKASKSKKIILSIISILVVAAFIVGAYAVLSATDSATNTFTVGNVEIEVVEPLWDETNPDGTIEKVVPTEVHTKDPAIKNTGDNDAYVYMRIWVPTVDGVKVITDTKQNDGTYTAIKNDQEIFNLIKETTGDSGEWIEIDSYKSSEQAYNYYLYAYTVPLAPNETTGTLFDKVEVVNIVNGIENVLAEYNNIVVEGFAIQNEFGETEFTYEKAWAAFVNQRGYEWPDNPTNNYYSFISYDLKTVQKHSYALSTATFSIPSAISTTIDGTFNGWVDEKGEVHSVGEKLSVEDLYIYNFKNSDEILNINPKLHEVITTAIESDNKVSSLPVKLIPINNQSTAMIERGWTYRANGPIESYNEGYNVITDEYGYNTPSSYNNWLVYGLEEGITTKKLFTDYVTVQGDGYAVITSTSGETAGTGTVIKVYDRNGTESTDDDTFVEQFYIVIHGDINGDGYITNIDYNMALEEDASFTTWSRAIDTENYRPHKAKAANLNNDMSFSITDAAQINYYISGSVTISQILGYASSK